MKTETHKKRAGKNRMREKLASLPVADKLRLVEKMRDEVLTPNTAREDQSDKAPTPASNQNGSLLLHAIQQTVERRNRGTYFVSESDQKQLASEVELLFADLKNGLEALRALFPDGVTNDLPFFSRLIDFEMRLGRNETSHRAAGLLLLLAVRELPPQSAEKLLREMTGLSGPAFFQALETLVILFAEYVFRPEFAAEWFPALVRRIGNDLASGGFWKALGIYCERQPQKALDVLRCLSTPDTEEEISVAAYILGVLRTLKLNPQDLAQFAALEGGFSASATAAARSVYYRSWIQTAHRQTIRKEDFQDLIGRMCAGSSDEKEQVFWIVCRVLLSPTISEDCFNFGLEWLRTSASDALTPVAKFNLIDFAARLPAIHQKKAADLVLSVQPISAEHKGSWQRLEQFMVDLLERDLNAFNEFLVGLARTNAGHWLNVLRGPREFEWLLSEMRGRDVTGSIGELIFDETAGCRKLGFFLFDELDVTTLPTDLLEKVDERRVGLAFHESQRASLHALAQARFLIILTSCLSRASSALQSELYDELVLQIKNYPGGCREEFQRHSKDFPLLKKAIAETDEYFEHLKQVRESGIAAMEVVGSRRALELSSRRFARAVSKGAEDMSVFMQMFKKVRLLYGKQWSNFHNGALSNSTGLQEFSSSVEIPRMEFIDPEGMNLRRLRASARIRELTQASSLHTDR